MAGFNFDLWLIKLLWTPAIKWPFYTVSIRSKFSLQRKHTLVLEESLMSSTMDMRTIVNELKFSLRINIFSHIARGCKKKNFTQSAWVYAWLKPFQTALSFRDSEWYIKMKNCACVIILKKKITHCGTAYTRSKSKIFWTQSVPFSMCFWSHETVLIEKTASDFTHGIWKKSRTGFGFLFIAKKHFTHCGTVYTRTV